MFGIGNTELVLIVLFGFLLFGPDKLPGMGRTIGRAIRQFRHAQEGVTKVVQSEIIDPIQKAADEPAAAAAKAAADDDSDLPEEDAADAKPAETFAQRRARLAAEKAAAAGESAEEASSEDAEAQTAEAPEAEPAQDEPEPAVDPKSVAALYGLDDEDDDDDLDDEGAPAASASGEEEA